ncbi:MAG: tetratricopeptide repeat protein [Candidatus Latescibacteria bacterium]|nr:tetratricopeptide repeat protein [Candidatus Latescibacterota bacterium]
MIERRCLIAAMVAILLVAGCGGGTGVGTRSDRDQQIASEAWLAYRAGNYAQADSTFKEALSVNPTLSDALNGRGWANFSLSGREGDANRRAEYLNAARENFSRAAAAEPKNADAWAGLAGVELASDNYQKAVSAAEQVLTLDPNYFSSHDNFNIREIRMILATAYFFLGKFSTAEGADPHNATAQVVTLDRTFRYTTPVELILRIQELQTR